MNTVVRGLISYGVLVVDGNYNFRQNTVIIAGGRHDLFTM